MPARRVDFYSEGTRLAGDLYLPDTLQPGEKRAGILLCHGYTGVRNLYLPDTAKALNEAGYVVLTFDYKGWGDSDGPKSRLSPYGRVLDSQAALTFLGIQDCVDPNRLGLYGTSYGGATVVWTAAVDPRVKAVVSVVGIGNGRRWMRSVRRPDEFADLLDLAEEDRIRRVTTGTSRLADRNDILLPDRQSAELAAAARRDNPAAVSEIPLEFIDDTLGFHPEWVVDKIAPRPVLFITCDDDRLVPPEESESLYAKAGDPKKLIILKGWGHYEVYTGEAFRQVITPTVAWYQQYLPAAGA
ncbi:MAG TPA: alpha/beta fold hydrolase [Rhodopila sp.]|nr:alpha/beta fold hydrolase [Rhodopila sp.]